MGKTLEELMAELERKARERMKASQPNSSATIYEDSGATVPESSDATVYEDGNVTVPEPDATICEDGGITVPGNETVSEKPVRESSSETYEKGHTLLDAYTVESDPIHGGMGSVWRVHHNNWNVDLAMKRPQAKLFRTGEQKSNFIRECEAWINLGLHPNIVSCYYVREIDGVPTIFSEWMENGSLENHIQKGTLYTGTGQEQQERLLDIAIQFARGLHYAHEQGLIHQDVKPDNLLLTKDWGAKVADFGLARARAQLTVLDGTNTVPDAGTVMTPSGGYTLAYCSMEQMDGKLLTRRTDIYSWAVSVMETYVGSRPWMNGVVAGLSCQDYFADTRVPMPEALKTLLAKCMASEPENRPHDFSEIEAALLKIYRSVTGNEYPRPVSAAAADTADSLNNRALSYLDMGMPDTAEHFWTLARQANPTNLHALYNQTLYLLRCGKLNPDDAENLIIENQTSSFIHANDEHIRLAYSIVMEISGEAGVQKCIYRMWELNMERETGLLETMLKSGQLTPNYVLSQIRDMRAYEEQERVYRKNLALLRKSMDDGDMRLATRTVAEFEHLCQFQPKLYGDCINRPEWLKLREQARRKGHPLDVSRTWTTHIIDGGRPKEKLSFSADSCRLLWGERLYDVKSGELLADNRSAGPSVPLCSALSPDGRFYLRECEGGFAQIDAVSGAVMHRFANDGKINDLIISADGHLAVSAGDGEAIWIWNLDTGFTLRGFKSPLKDSIQHVLLSYDNTKIVMQSEHSVCMYDMQARKLTDLGQFQRCRCVHIAANTQFTVLLFTLARETYMADGVERESVFGSAGVAIGNLETMRLRQIEGKDNNGVSLVFGASPVKTEFANNNVDFLYTVRSTVWVYSSEMDAPLEAVTVPGKAADSAMSRDGNHMAVSNGEKLHLIRVIRDFGAAQTDKGIYPGAWDDVIEFRALEYKSGRSTDVEFDELKKSAQKFVEYFRTPNRLRASDTDMLMPYAVILRKANPEKTPEQLADMLATELEDRSLGFVSRAKIMELLNAVQL